MNLICWVLPLSFVSIEGRLQHNRPKNGIGSFLLSHDDDHEHYNKETVMASFDLECLNGNEEIQDAKVESIINHFDGCLKKHDTTKQHFQYDKQGISFLQFSNSDGINCVNNHKNNGKFDYNLHCVDMFSYEPIFSLQSFGGVGENYTIFTNSSQYECVTQATDAASLPGGWAWGLDRTDSKTSDNLFTYPIVNGDNENGVDLYIVDTGIRSTHDEFYPGQVVHELGDGYARYDPFGYVASHGTHVAGTAGGKNFGVSKNLTIYDYRVCMYSEYFVPSSSSDTQCYWNLILTGLDMIRDRLRNNNRRGVINLSLGGSRAYFSELYDWYFTQIVKYGGIVVVPAGNSYADACDYSPAFSSSALTVGAVSSTLEMAYFSNWGNCVDVWAPGMDIYSGIASGDSDYAAYQGTSMAAPHICGFVANLLLINPGLTFNDIKYLLIESKNDVNASNQITTDECDPNYNGYECIFPLFDCNTLPNNYVGYDYISSTDAPIYDPILQTSETSYDVYNGYDFINYECNTIAVAIIDDDASTTNISVSEVVYEATDVCATRKTDNSLYTSWAYVCVDNDIAAFVAWEGETCDSNLYELSISKIIYDGMIDQGYWYHVKCDNEHPNYDNITDYKASVGDDNDCEVRVRLFFATDWIDLSDNIQQHLFNDSDSDKYNGIGSLIPSLLENATYSGNYQCTGFNTSDETYWDVVYAIGTCNWYNGGSSSYIITCDETLNTLTYTYYSGSDCSGSVTSTSTTYGGCYEDDGYYVDVVYCGTLPEYETPDDLGL